MITIKNFGSLAPKTAFRYDALGDLLLALDLLGDPSHHPMHAGWVANATMSMSAKEKADLAYWQRETGGFLGIDRLFFLERYGYDRDGFGQDPVEFMADPANQRTFVMTANEAAEDTPPPLAKLAADAAGRARFASFLAFFWREYVRPLIESHRREIMAVMSQGRAAVDADGLFPFLRGTSERISLGGAHGNDLLIDKRLELVLDGKELECFAIGPSLFSFPHLVVNYDAAKRVFFQISFDLPLRGGEKWLSEVDRLARIGFALSDKSRLRILLFVAGASPTQGEICDRMGYAKSTISRHMSILMDAGVVRRMCDAAGRQAFTLNLPLLEELTPSLLAWLGTGKKEDQTGP